MEQPRLFRAEHLPVRLAYQRLFSHLPTLQPHCPQPSLQGGRSPIDRNALLRALIYRGLRRLTSLSDRVQALRENPALLEAIGLDPLGDIPSLGRFSNWLRTTPNESLQDVRIQLLHALFAERAFSGHILALDSCPIPSPVRENNLKTAVRDRFNKLRLPKGDPTARLEVLTSFACGDARKVVYFWGYRNHVVADTETELPLWERTEPADRKESPLAVPLLGALLRRLALPVLLGPRPSLPRLRQRLILFVQQFHRYCCVVRLLQNVHACRTASAFADRSRPAWGRDALEVSRFSCMKCLGVSGVFDYAGLSRGSRYHLRPCGLPPNSERRRPDCKFSELNTQPTYTPVYASLGTSRYPAQNSGPSGSLALSREISAFSASYRFIPAHGFPS